MYDKNLYKNGNTLIYSIATMIAMIVLVFSTSCQETESDTIIVPSTVISSPPSITPKPTTPKATNTLAATISTSTNTPAHTPTPTNTAKPTATFATIQEEWFKYENDVYGFLFAYPTGWTPIELSKRVAITYQGSSISLRIWVKRVTEDTEIVRSGVPAGDLIMRGTVTFLGQELTKNVLVYQGKDKAVLYNNAGEVQVGDLVFAISLESNRSDYESIVIPEDIQEQADKILESFELIR